MAYENSLLMNNITTYIAPDSMYVMKDWVMPPTSLEIIGLIFIAIMVLLGTAGGLGGDGLLVPFILIFMKLPLQQCIPIGNFLGMIAGILRFVINFKERHPSNA